MIKIVFLIQLSLVSLFAFKIEAVEHNENKESYIDKNGRLVLNPIENIVLKPMDNKTLKPIDIKVLKPFKNKVLAVYNPALEKQKAQEKQKRLQQAKAKKEAIKKQFAKPTQLKIKPIKKENIKVEKDVTKFFNTLNKDENKPVNME